MAEVLNQDEINALLEAYASSKGQAFTANGPEKSVRLYDFSRPDTFSKDDLRLLKTLHERHGATLAVALSSMLRSAVRADLLGVDLLTYQEYGASIPDGTFVVEVSLEPMSSVAIFEFNPSMVFSCVDLLTGSPALSTTKRSEITEIDRSVMRLVVQLALKHYAAALEPGITLQPNIISIHSGGANRQIMLPSETIVMCGFEVSIGEHLSMMSICLPAAAVQGALPKLSKQRMADSSSLRQDKNNSALKRNFQRVAVECRAVLGRTTLPLGEIADLEVGDLIKLSAKASGPVELRIENVSAFQGKLGILNGNMAVQVIERMANPANGQPKQEVVHGNSV